MDQWTSGTTKSNGWGVGPLTGSELTWSRSNVLGNRTSCVSDSAEKIEKLLGRVVPSGVSRKSFKAFQSETHSELRMQRLCLIENHFKLHLG